MAQITGPELATSMLRGRRDTFLTAKQAKFLGDVLRRELQREMDDFNRRNPGPTAHQGRIRSGEPLPVLVNGEDYKLVIQSNGAGWLGPERVYA